MVRYLKDQDDLPATSVNALDMIDKYQSETVPMYGLKRRRQALAKYAKKLPDIPFKYGPWYSPRMKVTVTGDLMEKEPERRALNQAMAKIHVPFYLVKARVTRPGLGRVYIMTCTWHHDGTWFHAVPVSEGEVITATSVVKE